MAFKELLHRLDKVKQIYPKGTSERFKRLDVLQRALAGTVYNDALDTSFDIEEDMQGKYIPIKNRRPAFVYNIAKIIVEHTTALMFGEAHAPAVRVVLPNELSDTISTQHELLENIIEAIELDATCMEAMWVGSAGSAAIVMRQLDDKTPWFEIIDGKFCKPLFDPRNPKRLISLEQIYSCKVQDLEDAGYDGEYDVDLEPYWIRIQFDAQGEMRSFPLPQKKYEKLGEKDDDNPLEVIRWIRDPDRSYTNPFSFMNVHWVRNLERQREIDGESTFDEVTVDWMTEISYAMSQINRGFRYTADPTLAISRGELNSIGPLGGFSGGPQAPGSSNIVKSPARALDVPPGGDAKLLEITGQGLANSGEFVRLMREYALEVISGMKADQQHATSVHSGRALELLHKALTWKVEKLRISYGVRCYLVLLKWVLQALVDGTLVLDNVDASQVMLDLPLRLVWPQWETPSGQDLMATIQALEMAAGGSPQLPVPLVPREFVGQKAASAIGVSDANRAAAELMKHNGTTRLPIELEQQKNDIAQQGADTAKTTAEKPTPAPSSGK